MFRSINTSNSKLSQTSKARSGKSENAVIATSTVLVVNNSFSSGLGGAQFALFKLKDRK